MKRKQKLAAARLVLPLITACFLASLAMGALLTLPAQATVQAGEEARVRYTPEELEDTFQRLQTSIMSPYCQGLTLADCPTSGAVALRERIHSWLKEGRSADWIVDELAGEYGEWIRSAPEFSGFGLLAWLAPGAALILGAVWVGGYMRRNVEPRPDEPGEADRVGATASSQGTPEDEARRLEIEKRVEEELDAWQA